MTGRNCSALPGLGLEIPDLKRLMPRRLTLDTASKPTMLQSASMPLYANSDWDALRTAIRSLNCKDYRQVKIVRIKHPQCMSGIQVSRSYWEEIRHLPDAALVNDFEPIVLRCGRNSGRWYPTLRDPHENPYRF